jgi:hypothetical protein
MVFLTEPWRTDLAILIVIHFNLRLLDFISVFYTVSVMKVVLEQHISLALYFDTRWRLLLGAYTLLWMR